MLELSSWVATGHETVHSHPQKPQSFQSAPGIETSGCSQMLTLNFSANQICQICQWVHELLFYFWCWRQPEVLVPAGADQKDRGLLDENGNDLE